MPKRIPVTELAPAERMPIEVVQRQATTLAQLPLTADLLNSVLNYVFILNPQRQIVFASKNVRALVPGGAPEQLLGLRPGELLGCVHSQENPGGCGTTAFCGDCGAVKAILSSLGGRADVQECRLTRVVNCREEALDLLVYGTPLRLHDETYSLFAVTDISHQKRRLALERVFFHDLINSATGLAGLTEILAEEAPPSLQPDLQLLRSGFDDLLEEIQAQRDLASAETGDLALRWVNVNSAELLDQVLGMYRKHLLARDRVVRLEPGNAALQFVTDPVLLRRVLGNLIKNALEAVSPGGIVTVGCAETDQSIRFWVHNSGSMSEQARRQVFQRSFSTKGLGRGLGAYSVKLLTERYLRGKAGFTTDPEKGTVFFVLLPKQPAAP